MSNAPTTDRQIRSALKAAVRRDDPTAVLFDELPLSRGANRADLAAVNGLLTGFEIKSANDGLARLPGQIAAYDLVFDHSVAVVTERHLKAVRAAVPRHWGLLLAREIEGETTVEDVRQPRLNRNVCARTRMLLLWKTELVPRLRRRGIRFPAGTAVWHVWERAMAELSPVVIAEEVKAALKERDAPESAAT